MGKHWNRLKRSLGRRWREWCLPNGYERLGTRYGGWWIDTRLVGAKPLLIDCGLGEDISFPTAFLERFADARVIGVDPNPRSISYCKQHRPPGMEVLSRAFWTQGEQTIVFYLPRRQEQLRHGADGVSGSLDDSHEYVGGGGQIEVRTIDLDGLLAYAERVECDVLKMDIEGAEYELLEALASSGKICFARQVLVEFHHGWTRRTLADTQKAVDQLAAAGFHLAHTEGRNFIFRRNDA